MRGKMLLGAAGAALLAGFASAASAQGADPGNDAATAALLPLAQQVNGDIDPAGDSDWYRLQVAAGQRYHVTLDGVAGDGEEQGLDTMLVIHGGDGDELASNDDTDGSLNSALFYVPTQAGDVLVEARGFSDAATGHYALRADAAPVPPDNAGNDSTTRSRVAAGRPVSGALEYDGDVDWFRLSARTGQSYHITLNGAAGAAEPLGDPMLRIVGADGQELASNDDGEDGLNSALDFIPAANGEVFVEAGAFGGAAMGAYTLAVSAARLPPDAASGDRGTRARLTIGQSVDDGLDYPGDRDWRRIQLEAGAYRFALMSRGAEADALADPVLKIFNSAGEEVASDDDGGEGFNSYLEFTAPSAGAYFVEASSFGEGAKGAYRLSAMAGDIPADAGTDVGLSPDGDYREGVLSPAGDKDWYRLNLAEGQGVRIGVDSTVGDNALGDPYVAVHGPDGAELAQDDDGGEGLNSWLEFTAPAAGAYYIEVRGFDEASGEGRYTVQVTAGEIGADAETAEALSANGEGRAGAIGPAGDADWFSIELVEGRPYRFNLESPEGGIDPMLTLYDQKGVQVASDDDGGAGVNSYVSFVSTTGGTYYAAASAFGDTGTGAYTLRVSDTDVPGSASTDETLSAAGDDRLSRIDMPGDLDSYRVEMQAGIAYTIDVKGEGDTPLTDPFLGVLNSSGDRVTSDDDSGDGLDARVTFTPETADVYYIQASGLAGSTGWYRVSIASDSDGE